MKLYTNPRSRGMRVHWTLEELGVPYDLAILDMQKGEHRQPEYLKVHPLGQVPALQDDGHNIIESGAICVYLAHKYPEKKLGPEDQAAEYFQWCFYNFASLEGPMMDVLIHTQWAPEDQRVPSVAEKGQAGLKKVLTHIESHMADGREWILGKRFSVADILLGGTLQWMAQLLPITDYPNLQAYVGRLNARPAYQRIQQPVAS